MANATQSSVLRLMDANANRLREGLRVCEDTMRFIYALPRSTAQLKRLRHRVTAILLQDQDFTGGRALQQRRVEADVGRPTIDSELQRADIPQILAANLQRAKESVRVLEEFAKIRRSQLSEQWKQLRYDIYAVEQSIMRAVVPEMRARKGKKR